MCSKLLKILFCSACGFVLTKMELCTAQHSTAQLVPIQLLLLSEIVANKY